MLTTPAPSDTPATAKPCATVTRCRVSVLVDAPERDAALVEELARALVHFRAATVIRQIPGRIYATPTRRTVADLAERVARWLGRARVRALIVLHRRRPGQS